MKKILVCLCCLVGAISSLNAANIRLDGSALFLQGPIVSGDYQQVVQLSNQMYGGDVKILVLKSPGGAAYEGMRIAEYIRKNNFYTAVLPDSHCYSACAFIWAGGITRFADLPSSRIGFHAVYDPRTLNEKGSANAVLGAMFGRFGYSDSAIRFMTESGPKELSYLTKRNSINLGINYIDFKDMSVSLPTTYNEYRLSAYDVVAGFYNALSIADGDLAAAYVIPEKRGVGPFNQQNIYNFYASLKQRLTVYNITQINESQFKVHYHYVAGRKQCNTSALVSVVNYYGINLIQSIKATC